MNRIFQNTFRILAVLMLGAWAGASFAGDVEPPPVSIPEPTTMLLIGAGVGAAALVRRMRK